MTRTMTSSTSTQQSHLLITVQSAGRFPKSTRRGTRMRSCEVLKSILKSSLQQTNVKNAQHCPQNKQWSMLHRRKQQSLRIQSRGWQVILKHSWTCRIRPRRDEQSCLRRKVSRRRSMWMMKVLARKKDLLVRKLEAKAKEARVVSGLRSHCQLDIGRIVRGVNPFLRRAKKPRMPYARSWKPTRKNSSRNITRRSCGKPSNRNSLPEGDQ